MLSPTTRSLKFTICDVICVNTKSKKLDSIQIELYHWYYSSKEITQQVEKQSLIKAPLEIHHITNIRRVIKLYSMEPIKFLKLSTKETEKK